MLPKTMLNSSNDSVVYMAEFCTHFVTISDLIVVGAKTVKMFYSCERLCGPTIFRLYTVF